MTDERALSTATSRACIEWTDTHRMRAGDTTFVTLGDEWMMTPRFNEISAMSSSVDLFVLQKPRRLIDAYVSAVEALRPKTILEFGIFKGGSIALLSELAHPVKHVAIELTDERVAALDLWVEERGLAASVSTHYGVSQDDEARVSEIVDAEFGDQPIDLIIDDASHALRETTVTFNLMFPRLRAGGGYLIEDWALAEHLRLYTPDAPPLAGLLPTLFAAWAMNPDLFDHIAVDWSLTSMRKGWMAVDPPFDIARLGTRRDEQPNPPS